MTAAPESERPFILAFVGDVMLGRDVERALAHRSPESFWGPVLPLLRQADLAICNLETPITTSAERWKGYKTFKFKASPHTLAILQAANIALVGLANNHTGDYGTKGLLDTFEHLEQAGIGWCGAGRTLAEARRPAVLERRGLRVAVAGFSDRMPEYQATDSTPGHAFVWPPKGLGPVGEILAPFRGLGADLKLMSIHWGADLLTKPLRSRRAFARALIEGGIDVIHGHSSHMTQGVELIDGKPVIYDNGNAIQDFWRYFWPWTQRSAIFLLELGRDASRLLQIPVVTHGMRLATPQPALLRAMQARFARLSGLLGTNVRFTEEGLEMTLDCRLPVHFRPASLS
ncbi:MAG TPA: CapA family protein [Kiloniellales bacterium]|nr:CapA family protein [Kiloniellales bacterium]